MKETLNLTEQKMEKCIRALENEFSTIRAGRANPAVLDKIQVEMLERARAHREEHTYTATDYAEFLDILENNYKLIQKEVNKDLGNYVKDWTIKGILTCAVIDEDDFYYLIMDKDRIMHFSSCVGKYKLIEDLDSLSNDFSVLFNKIIFKVFLSFFNL